MYYRYGLGNRGHGGHGHCYGYGYGYPYYGCGGYGYGYPYGYGYNSYANIYTPYSPLPYLLPSETLPNYLSQQHLPPAPPTPIQVANTFY